MIYDDPRAVGETKEKVGVRDRCGHMSAQRKNWRFREKPIDSKSPPNSEKNFILALGIAQYADIFGFGGRLILAPIKQPKGGKNRKHRAHDHRHHIMPIEPASEHQNQTKAEDSLPKIRPQTQ